MLAYFAVLTSRSQKTRVVSVDAAVVLVALVGFSRVYLDTHFISDVVGGFAARGAWLSAVITGLKSTWRRDTVSGRDQVSSP